MFLRLVRPARNVMEAASNGAIAAVKVVSSVAANLIAILGLIAFLDAAISYLGSRVGFPELSFKVHIIFLFDLSVHYNAIVCRRELQLSWSTLLQDNIRYDIRYSAMINMINFWGQIYYNVSLYHVLN